MFGRKKRNKPTAALPPQPAAAHVMDGYGTEEWYDKNAFLLSVVDAKTARSMRLTSSCLKGGVGKTSTVLGMGHALSLMRRDLVTIIDANPHRGTAAERLGQEHALTVRDLLDNLKQINTQNDMARFTSQARTRLEIVASDKDPEKQELFSAEDYRDALDVLSTFRGLTITDTGIDLLLPMMSEVYHTTDNLVIAATTAADGYRLAAETLDFWEKHAEHGPELVRNAVVALTVIEPFTLTPEAVSRIASVDQLQQMADDFFRRQQAHTERLVERLQQRVRAVVTVPYDTTLSKGYLFDWTKLAGATQDAYVELAYQIALGFPENERWRNMPRAEAERQWRIEQQNKPQIDAWSGQAVQPVQQYAPQPVQQYAQQPQPVQQYAPQPQPVQQYAQQPQQQRYAQQPQPVQQYAQQPQQQSYAQQPQQPVPQYAPQPQQYAQQPVQPVQTAPQPQQYAPQPQQYAQQPVQPVQPVQTAPQPVPQHDQQSVPQQPVSDQFADTDQFSDEPLETLNQMLDAPQQPPVPPAPPTPAPPTQ